MCVPSVRSWLTEKSLFEVVIVILLSEVLILGFASPYNSRLALGTLLESKVRGCVVAEHI